MDCSDDTIIGFKMTILFIIVYYSIYYTLKITGKFCFLTLDLFIFIVSSRFIGYISYGDDDGDGLL